jgi:hypothetical protein
MKKKCWQIAVEENVLILGACRRVFAGSLLERTTFPVRYTSIRLDHFDFNPEGMNHHA